MNIVNSGSMFQVYGDSVKTFKQLPVASYDVGFSKQIGFFLTHRPDLAVNEEKVYGNHSYRIKKVMDGFHAAERNFGIILSGQKGIGKSLFARMLAEAAISNGIPVITVTSAIPGVADFLASIEQEVLIVFDEFEKNFMAHKHDDWDPQVELLSLFDGMDNGKKLFCITCNDPHDLNEYLINRPGRFHYHFTINTPTDVEVREYMRDKLLPEYHDQIEKVVMFAQTTNVSYDYLRAIAFELNQGYSFEESLGDLNISRNDDTLFDIRVILSDGSEYFAYSHRVDLYSRREDRLRMHLDGDYKDKSSIIFSFSPVGVEVKNNRLTISKNKCGYEFAWERYEDMSDDDEAAARKADSLITIKDVEFLKRDITFVKKYLV